MIKTLLIFGLIIFGVCIVGYALMCLIVEIIIWNPGNKFSISYKKRRKNENNKQNS